MEIKDWITLGTALLSALILIASWFIINRLNRKNEIAKERLKFRLDILLSIIDVFNEAQRLIVISDEAGMTDKEYTAEVLKALGRLTLFGKKEEIALCRNITIQLQHRKVNDSELIQLMALVRDRIKSELKI